ncbi:HEPN domain-containing protein [Candidatus Woesearchaeota archaeon]|nr:HEPN domain-containing protein [Candidatus Woesearchaeota archaeon]
MKEEVKRWWRMAKDDLDSARSNFKSRKYYVCAFLSQQAVEKALKALLLRKKEELIKIHDLVILGREVGLQKDFLDKCEQLSKVYIETRYGSIGEYVPSEKFTKKNSSEYLKIAEDILKWVKKNI